MYNTKKLIPMMRRMIADSKPIVVCVDNSSSSGLMEGQGHLTAFLQEIRHNFPRNDIRLLVCNNAIDIDATLYAGAEIPLIELEYYSGTSFEPPFRVVREPPALLVYITDGYGPAPTTSDIWWSDVPVIWALTRKDSPRHFTFGKMLKIC